MTELLKELERKRMATIESGEMTLDWALDDLNGRLRAVRSVGALFASFSVQAVELVCKALEQQRSKA